LKPIKFFKSEKDHFSAKTFLKIEKNPPKFKYRYLSLIIINKLIKINLEIASTFFEKVVLLGFKEFDGLQDDLKIMKKLTGILYRSPDNLN